MSFYRTGTASITNGIATVTGSSTLWVDAGVLNPGDIFMSTDAKIYEILSIQSNTGLTLTSDYLGSTLVGQDYEIIPIGLLPSALAQQVKSVLTSANTALASMVRYDIATMGLSGANQQNARTNIGALGAVDVGAGRLVKSVAGGVDVTLTAAEAANQFLEFTGAITASINVIVPVAARVWPGVYNGTTGAYTLTVKTPAGTGTLVAQGKRAALESDGTNVIPPVDSLALKGTSTTDSAAAGYVGEIVESLTPSATVNTTVSNTNSIALTAGDWDVAAILQSSTSGTNTWMKMGLSSTSGAFEGFGSQNWVYSSFNVAGAVGQAVIPRLRFSLAAPATVYMVAIVSTANIVSGCSSFISARRMR